MDWPGTATSDRFTGVPGEGQDAPSGSAEGTPSQPAMALLTGAGMVGGEVGEAPVLGVASSGERIGFPTGLTDSAVPENSAVPEMDKTAVAPELLTGRDAGPQQTAPPERAGQIRVEPFTMTEPSAAGVNAEVAFAVVLRPSKESQPRATAEAAPPAAGVAMRISAEPETGGAVAWPSTAGLAAAGMAMEREALLGRQPNLPEAAKSGPPANWMAETKPTATPVAAGMAAAASIPQPRQFSRYFPPKTTVSQAPARFNGSTTNRAEPRSGIEDRTRTAPPAVSTERSEPQPGPSRTAARQVGMESGSNSRPAARDAAEGRRATQSERSEFAKVNELSDLQGAASVRAESKVSAQPVEVESGSVRETVKALRSAVLEQRANPAATVREVSFRVTDANRAQATVQLVERDGRIQVTVRTADTELAKELRLGLNDLMTSLEKNGIRGEAWKPVGAAVESSSMEFRRDERNHEGNRQQAHTPGSDGGQQGQAKQNPFKRMFYREDLESLTSQEETVWT
ncbi:MAG: hypothetical protein HY820_29425 [Acidobacteria bacterium]|nr:hypothetical protein [Acidobacteriota bacterium]